MEFEAKDIFQKYLIYYYAKTSLGTQLKKRCFESEDELKIFIKAHTYEIIDNLFIDGKKVNYKIETNITFE